MPERDDEDGDFDEDDFDGADTDDVFALGRHPTDDMTPDELAHRRSTKRFALWALAVVAVVVAVAITLVASIDESGGAPSSPHAAAQRWANDVVHGDRDDLRSVQCDDASSANVLSLILYAPIGAHAGPAVQAGAKRWGVHVTFDEAGGATNGATLTVVLRKGAYLVC